MHNQEGYSVDCEMAECLAHLFRVVVVEFLIGESHKSVCSQDVYSISQLFVDEFASVAEQDI